MTESFDEQWTRLQTLCTDRLGPDIGRGFASLATPAVLVSPRDEQSAGRSQLGGDAWLDPGTPWPTWEDVPLALLAVLAVLDLSELPAVPGVPVPSTGLINFFFPAHGPLSNFDLKGPAVVSADPATGQQVRSPHPRSYLDKGPVQFSQMLTLPRWPDHWEYEPEPQWRDRLTKEVLEELNQVQRTWRHGFASGVQAFGYADAYNPPNMPPLWKWDAADPGFPEPFRPNVQEHLLFETSADEGDLYFVISDTALSAGEFTATKLDLQAA